jgi:Pyridoxamine 5'-phosphate oxidase
MPQNSAPPTISDDLMEHFASGVDVYVATRSAELMPESLLGMGVRVHPDRRTVTVYIPAAAAATTLANLRDNGQIAATFCYPPEHRAVQIKGRYTGHRESTPADREIQEIFRSAMITSFALIGIPRVVTRGLAWWPSIAIDFEVSDVYAQSPGPGAGERISA